MVKTLPFNAGDAGWILCRGATSHMPHGQKKQNMKQKRYCNKFNKDLKKKNGPHQKKNLKNKKNEDIFNPVSDFLFHPGHVKEE